MTDSSCHPASGSKAPSKGKKIPVDPKEKSYWEGKMFEEFAALERPKGLNKEAWEQALSWYRLGHDSKWIKQQCPSWFAHTDDAKKIQLLPLILSKAYISKQREVYGAGSLKISNDLHNIYGFSLERHELEKMFLKWNLTTPKVREHQNTAFDTADAQLAVEEDFLHLDEHQENPQTRSLLQIQNNKIKHLEAQAEHFQQQLAENIRLVNWLINKINKFEPTWATGVAGWHSQITKTQEVSQLDTVIPFPQFTASYSTTPQVETGMTDISHQINDSSMDEHIQQFGSEIAGYTHTQPNHNLISNTNAHNTYSRDEKGQNTPRNSAISNTFSVTNPDSNSDTTGNIQQQMSGPHQQYSQPGSDSFQWLDN